MTRRGGVWRISSFGDRRGVRRMMGFGLGMLKKRLKRGICVRLGATFSSVLNE